MIRTLLHVLYAVLFAATAVFAVSAIMMGAFSILVGIGMGNLVIVLLLAGLSLISYILHECVGIFTDG